MAGTLASLNFDNLLGSPLLAAIEAQVQGSMCAVNYFKIVGFEQSMMSQMMSAVASKNPMAAAMVSLGKPRMVYFQFPKRLPDGKEVTHTLSVPFLTMVPLPNLRVTNLRLDFNVRITSQVGSDREVGSSYTCGDFTTKRISKTGCLMQEDFSMKVRVVAKAPPMPQGLEKVLEVLEATIKDQVNEEKAAEQAAASSQTQPTSSN